VSGMKKSYRQTNLVGKHRCKRELDHAPSLSGQVYGCCHTN
jgi:hypothetical protein